MIIIGIDPGITTGCVVRDGEDTLFAVEIVAEDLREALEDVARRYPECRVIAEAVYAVSGSRLGAKLVEVREVIRDVFPTVRWVTPGVWKGWFSTSGLDETFGSRHIDDAFGIAVWGCHVNSLN